MRKVISLPTTKTLAKKAIGLPFHKANITIKHVVLKANSNSSHVKQYHTTLGTSFNNDEKVLRMETSSSGKAQTRVELTNFEEWTSEQVCEMLLAPKGKGGASLYKDDVKTLLDAKFDGTSIGKIVEGIKKQKENPHYDPVHECLKDFPKVHRDDIRTVVNWVEKLLKRTPYNTKTPDSIIAARTDPKFEYLRDLKDNPHKWKELELKIGQNIELPTIGEVETHFVPKDYEPNVPYLLTKQRFKILKEVVLRTREGFAFSGPHGIAKSYTMLLIAAYAIVNSIPLLYVPRCGVWVSKFNNGGEAEAEDFLRTLLCYYNYDILSPPTIDQLLTTRCVVSFLARELETTKPRFLLLDEHNELFKPLNNGHVAITENYFYSYRKWTCITCGTVAIYCGGDSNFVLPGGGELNLINITPPNRSEFQKLLEAIGFKLNEERANRVEYATGRMPREVKLFADFVNGSNDFTDEQVKQFVAKRQDFYLKLIETSLTKELANRTGFNYENLLKSIHYLFNLAFSGERAFELIQGLFYDQGIFYRTTLGRLNFINEAAKRALFSFYVNRHDIFKIRPIEVECDLERLIIRNEYKLGKSNHRYHLISSGPVSSESIEYNINSKVGLDITELDDMRFLSRKFWPEQESILFTPNEEKFPTIDYFIVSYISAKKIQLVLKQVTLSTVDTHYTGDFTKLFSPKYLVAENKIDSPRNNFEVETNDGSITGEYTYSLFELIIHSIMDNFNECSSVILEKETKKEKTTVIERTPCDYRKKKFNYTDKLDLERTITVDGVEISWYFVYESFTSEANQQTKSVKHSNVNYRNKEDLERSDLLLLSN